MPFLIRIQPVTGDPRPVVRVITRLLGPDSREQARALAERGGVVFRGLNEQAAEHVASQLEEAGAEASVQSHEDRPDGDTLEVRDAQTGQAVPGAIVTLYAKEIPEKPLATAVTDGEGRATMEGFGEAVAERFPGERPTIRARVMREGGEADVSHKPFQWDAYEAGDYTFILEAAFREAPSGAFVVRGAVALPGGKPAAGYRVRAEDRDLRRQELLGEAVTDDEGRYEIAYQPARFGKDEKGRADLHLRVFTHVGRELPVEVAGRDVPTVQAAQILFNAEREEEVNLTITTKPKDARTSLYEEVAAALAPLPDGLILSDLTPDDVRFLHHDTGRSLEEVAFAADDARLALETGLPAAVFFGLAMQQIGVAEPGDADEAPVPCIALDVVLDRSGDALMEAVDAALKDGLIPAALEDEREVIRTRLEELKGGGRATTTPEGLHALRDLAGRTLDDLGADQPPVAALVRDRAVAALRAPLGGAFASAPADVRAAVEAVDLHRLDPETHLRTALTEELESRGAAPQTVRDVQTRLATADLPRSLGEVMQPGLPLERNPLVSDDLRRARHLRVGALAGVDEGRLLDLLGSDDGPRDLSDGALTQLVDTGDLNEGEAGRLGFASDLYGLLGRDDALADALRNASFDGLPDGRLTSTRDLARLSADELEPVLAQADLDGLLDGTSPQDLARRLAARFEYLHPDEALFHRAASKNGTAAADALGRVNDLLTSGDAPFDPSFDLLEDTDDAARDAFAQVRGLANTFAGLGVQAILQDADRSPEEKAQAVEESLKTFQDFRNANADQNLLALDLTPGSADLDALDWGGLQGSERKGVTNTLKSFQRTYAVARSAPLAETLLATGYHSAVGIAGTSFDAFVANTGFDVAEAQAVYTHAQATTGYVTSVAGSVLDILKGGFIDLGVGNVGPSIQDFLQELDGYEDLFGSLDFCNCEHCQSILGPAAYFVDLMLFIEQHVLDKHFAGGGSDDTLNLKVRRPDLWTLELTCEHTNTLLPTLTVVNEVLENYVATRRGYDGSRAVGSGVDRSALEDFVYGEHLAETTSSFEQPFLLPLRELEVYLGHFDRTRGDVAAALGAPEPVETRALLGLSLRGYELVTTPNADLSFLEGLYDLDFDVGGADVEPFDAQELLGPTGLSREELGRLVATAFVSPAGEAPVEIRSEKHGADSVQNDIERIRGLTLGALDRMHRFTRLWRALPWRLEELDLVVEALATAGLGGGLDSGILRHVALLAGVQERLGTSVEETLALWTDIPRRGAREDADPLFDRLFNAKSFTDVGDPYPQPGTSFVHPAWDPESDTAPLHRLVAGLRVSDEDLYALIVHLADPLGVDLDSADPADQGFALTEANLALLYRHARLAEHLDLDVAALFQLLSFLDSVADDHVDALADLRALLDGYDRWQASPYALDDLGGITGGSVLTGAEAHPAPDALATALVEAVAEDGALTFADTLFAYLDGLSEADSRALLGANAGATEAVAEANLLRLADDFDTAAALTLPAGVTVDEAEVRAVLVAHHASEVLPAYLATQLGTSVEKTQALLALLGADLHDAALAAALRGDAIDPLTDLIEAIYPLHLLFAPNDLTADDVAFVEANDALFALADLANVTPEAAWRTAAYHRLLAHPDGTAASEDAAQAHRADLQAVLLAHDGADFDAAGPVALAGLFGVEDGLIVTLREALDLGGAAVHALERLGAAVELAQYLGVGGEALRQIVGEDYETHARARDAVLGAFRAKYSDEQTWLDTVEPFEDRILVLKRDALVDYLLHAVHPEFDDAGDLYHHFLLDVEVDSCARTSRVVEATASLQLYVHRCLMNLEQDRRAADDPARTHVQPQDIPADEWAWRKNYRVWEANRKVFLYPETYIEPELRDNKTPLFEELEATLLQKPVDEQAVLDAYAQYVRGFEEVARLQVAGAYHDEGRDTDVLHLFGVTADEPPQFYYRTIENLILSESDPTRGVVYGPWRKVEVQIPARRVAPVVFRGTLYLFWVEIASRPKTDFEGGESKFRGYHHNFAFKYTARRLDGTWTAPQSLDLSAHTDYPFNAGPGVLFESLYDSGTRPYYDTETHDEPEEGYTLTGSRFDRLYPDPHEDGTTLYLTGITYKVHAAVDFYTNALGPRAGSYVDRAVRWTGSIERGKLVTTRSHNDHWDLYLSTPDGHLFDDYAYASIVADSRRIGVAALNWDSGGDLEDAIRGDLYQRYLGRLPAPTDVTVVNGAVSDALVDLAGDILYVQGSARDGERALVRRMGTTLAEDVGRTLVTQGVGGLLDLDAQRAFQEAASPLYEVQSALDDAVNAGALDFRGPYGTYYRELFFHVPFLIADHLNSQQHFEEAQKWYHYLFDPTAPVEDPVGDETDDEAVRDRPWRYLEFRGLDAQTLRDQLTDPAAIETYEKDPFNPHAIARLRLSAYQKAIVMKYVDNLIDWGDALFARDTREAITEAMLLYITAADILGDRPAELGSCGEGTVTPKTYERIAPLIEEGSPFLVELEHFTLVHTPRVVSTVPAGTYTLGTAAVADVVHAADKVYDVTYTQPFAMHAAAPAGAAATTTSIVDEPGLSAAGGDGLNLAAEASGGSAPGLVYRSDWARTKTASWQGAGTPLAQNPAAAGTAGTVVTGAAGGAAGAETVRPGLLDGGATLNGATAWGTHLRPDLLDDLQLPSFGLSLMRQVSPVFCVPANAELGDYWERVEDRLYKIRHCMNISGVRRQLALFAPPIDPRLLVRARAAGLSLEDALGLTAGELPPYRFAALIGRARAYAQTVQGFGAALLGALEKKDAEELARLRLVHQENLAKLTMQVREQEVEAAAKAIEALQKRKATVEYRLNYYQGLVDTGLLSPEQKQVDARSTAATLNEGAALLDTLAAVLYLIPEVGAPTAMKYGGKQTGSSGFTFAEALRDGAKLVDSHSALHGLQGGNQRREQGWEHQVALAEKELDALEPQIEAATIRWEITVAQLAVHERSIEQVQEVFDFYGEKFSGLGLYTWLSSTLQRLYRDAYNSALAMARLAEQAFRFERRDLADVGLGVGHWDAGRAGLLAGEQLLLELQAMERRFIETDDRRLEVDQAFSLQQIDPAALVQLKETGACTFTLPERYFDLFYPGQYRRVIKAVRLTVPCVTGPYVNVSATLSLLSSEVRLDADPAAAPTPAPSSRTTTVAASTAQNDAGVFELSFRGERYLPFEGAGAVNSQWRLTLPTAFKPFDYDSINDVLLRISYTAEYTETLKDHVEKKDAALEGTLMKVLKDEGMARSFRFRQEFSTAFHRLLQASLGEAVPFEITEQHFPLFLRGRALSVKRALLAVQPADGAAAGTAELAFDGIVISGFAALPELGDLPGVDLSAALTGDPRGEHALEVRAPGGLALDAGAPPALDAEKVEDLVLYIEYGLDV